MKDSQDKSLAVEQDRKEIAESLFGILPPDAKGKRFYTQEEVEEELKNLDDVEFEDD